MRLDRLLANLNYGSRNDIKEACKNSRVKVNNKIIKDSSYPVVEKDKIEFDDNIVFHKDCFLRVAKIRKKVSLQKFFCYVRK